MSNKLTKLLISFTTAAALGATAVIANPSNANAASKVTGAQREKNLKILNNQLNNSKINKIEDNYNSKLKLSYNKSKIEYLNTKSQLDTYGTNISQSQNSVSVNLPNGYKNNVQNTLNNYMTTKNGDTLSKSQTNLIQATQPATLFNTADRNYKTYQMLTYTGHTTTDSKKFYVGSNYYNAVNQLTPRDMQEIQQVVANAGNALRSATGITNQVGTLIPNQTAYSVSQTLSSNLNSMTVDDTANQNGINGDFLMDVYNRNVANPMGGSIQTEPSNHKNKKFDLKQQTVLTLADVKQLYLNALMSSVYQIDLLGLQQYQLDNTSQYGTSDSYVGFDNTSGQTNPAMLVTIPKNINSLSNPDFSNPFAKLDAANLTQTNAQTNVDKTQLESVVTTNKQDYENKKKQVDAFFNKYNRLTGNPKNNRVAGTNSMRWNYFAKTGKAYIPGGYKVPESIKKLKVVK